MKSKIKTMLFGLFSLLLAVTIPVKVNAATTGYGPSSDTVSETQNVYTLPPQPSGESPKGTGQDRQPLGYVMRPGSSITITNNSDIGFTVQLLNDNSAATISKRVPAHSTVTIEAPNPAVPQTNKAGKAINDNANDVDLVPYILTPRTNNTSAKVSCDVKLQGPHTKLPVFSYTNDNQATFMDEWKQSGSYALIQGKGFQIMLPADAQSYVENMDKAPEGMDANGQPKPVPQGQKYVCHNLMDVLHFYDDVLYPTYDKIAGLSTDAKEPYNKLVPGKYFYTSDIKGSGGANYSSARTEYCGVDDSLCWLQPNWALFHETGHGYQTRELGGTEADQHVMEVSNNVLGNYMYYYILFGGNTKGADEYSWNYMSAKGSDKKQMETDVHNILVNNNWSWDQILPHNGGRGKHLGLILLQNMVEKMTYAGWTEVYQMDRQQVYEANQKKETDLNDKLMNIWDLITKAASDHGYDYTAIMDEIGKTPQLPLSQEARQKQDKAVNFLWYLMPKASYDQVYAVVQELAKADPSLVYDSNFTLVTPDQTKKLNLNGKLNLTIYDLPSSWAGKTINIMDGNQVYGTLTIGPDGKCSLDNVPLGTYTLAGLPDNDHTLTNYYVTVTDDPAYMNSTDVIPHSESSSTSSSTSSSKHSSSSSVKSSSSSKSSSMISSSSLKSSSRINSSSKIKSSSSRLKSSSLISSSSKKSSVVKSSSKASSKKSSSNKALSSIKSSSEKSSSLVSSSSKKSSVMKSSSKASSKKSSSIKASSSIKSSSEKSSSEVSSSSKKSSEVKSSSKASMKYSSSKASSSIKSSSVKSSSEVSSSSKKSLEAKSSSQASMKYSSRKALSSIKSSSVKSSSEVSSSKKSSAVKSLSKASSKKSSSIKASSSIKSSSVKSSSLVSSSKKSSVVKSSSKASSKKSSSSKASSSIKSSSEKSSSLVSSSKKSSEAKSSSQASMKYSSRKTSSSIKSQSVKASSMKSALSHRGGGRPVKSSSLAASSSKMNNASSSLMSESSKVEPAKQASSSIAIPVKSSLEQNMAPAGLPNGQATSKATTVISTSIVNVSSVENVPVTVSSTKEVPVPVKNGSSVVSSMVKQNVPVTSMVSKTVAHSSEVAIPVKSELPGSPAKAEKSSMIKVVQQPATTVNENQQNAGKSVGDPNAGKHVEDPNARGNEQANTATARQATNNNNNQFAAQNGSKKSTANTNSAAAQNSSKNHKLPQTGEAETATIMVIAGIALAALGYALLKKIDK